MDSTSRERYLTKRQARRRPLGRQQVARAVAVIEALSRLWPQCFQLYECRRRPLAIGIDKALIDTMAPAIKAGRISVDDLNIALKRYTLADGYLIACQRAGADRIGLDGKSCGAVSAEQANDARRQIAQRRARRAQRSISVITGNADEHPAEASTTISAEGSR
jgi:sRNA-binding protein